MNLKHTDVLLSVSFGEEFSLKKMLILFCYTVAEVQLLKVNPNNQNTICSFVPFLTFLLCLEFSFKQLIRETV